MTRTDFGLALAFLVSVAVAVGVAFGNPLRLEGNNLQEFFGYIVGLSLAVAVLFTVTNYALFRNSEPGNRGAG